MRAPIGRHEGRHAGRGGRTAQWRRATRRGATIVKAAVKHLALPRLALTSATAAAPPLPGGRDLRLDLFRGIALWLIFLDHIPRNIVNWFTIRNYGFSAAPAIFIFISGYTAAFVYGRATRARGLIVGR